MKKILIIVILIFCLGILFSATSCVVLVKEDNGRHNGWFKNPRNPHNPNHAVYVNNLDQSKHRGNNKK